MDRPAVRRTGGRVGIPELRHLVSSGASCDRSYERYLCLKQEALRAFPLVSESRSRGHRMSTHPRRLEAAEICLLSGIVARSLAGYTTACAQPGEECSRLNRCDERGGHRDAGESAYGRYGRKHDGVDGSWQCDELHKR